MLKIRIFITLKQLSMNGVHLQKKVKKRQSTFLKKILQSLLNNDTFSFKRVFDRFLKYLSFSPLMTGGSIHCTLYFYNPH